jgi:hypothetical protein
MEHVNTKSGLCRNSRSRRDTVNSNKLLWIDYLAILITIIAVVMGLWLCIDTMQVQMINCTVEHPCTLINTLKGL